MSSVWHRFLRGAAFLGGVALGVGAAVFGYSNSTEVAVHWWRFSFDHVSIGWVALVPLLAGVAAGYVYHLPARMHHFSEHMRHRHLVHELEKENKELQKSLDRLLEMPDDSIAPKALKAAPVAALVGPGDHADAGSDLDEAMIAEPVIVHEVRQAAPRKPKANGHAGSNGHKPAAKAPAKVIAKPAAPKRVSSRRRAKLEPEAAELRS